MGRALPVRSNPAVGLGQECGDTGARALRPTEGGVRGGGSTARCERVVASDARLGGPLPSADLSEELAGWEVTCRAGGRMGSWGKATHVVGGNSGRCSGWQLLVLKTKGEIGAVCSPEPLGMYSLFTEPGEEGEKGETPLLSVKCGHQRTPHTCLWTCHFLLQNKGARVPLPGNQSGRGQSIPILPPHTHEGLFSNRCRKL